MKIRNRPRHFYVAALLKTLNPMKYDQTIEVRDGSNRDSAKAEE